MRIILNSKSLHRSHSHCCSHATVLNQADVQTSVQTEVLSLAVALSLGLANNFSKLGLANEEWDRTHSCSGWTVPRWSGSWWTCAQSEMEWGLGQMCKKCSGLLNRCILLAKIRRDHHLPGNVQVFNVRIPDVEATSDTRELRGAARGVFSVGCCNPFLGMGSQLPKANRPFNLLVFQFWSIFSKGPKRLTF